MTAWTRPQPRRRRTVFALAAAAVLAACGTSVPRPTSDTTAPKALMSALGLPATLEITDQDVQTTVHPGEDVVLLGKGVDPEGVKIVRMQGSYTLTCRRGDLGESKPLTVNVSNEETSPSSSVPTERLAQLNIGVDQLRKDCSSGYSLAGYAGSVRTTAENYGGGTSTTGSLSFSYQAGPRTGIRVVTYNILGAGNPSLGVGPFRNRLQGFITALGDADIVFLQEVWWGTQGEDQVALLADGLKLPHIAIGRHTTGSPADVVILSRYPLTGITSHHPPEEGCVLGINCPKHRVVLVDATATIQGLRLRLLNTHWQPNSEDWRRAAGPFMSAIVKSADTPVIFGGDLNARRGSQEVNAILAPPLTDALAGQAACLEPADDPLAPIDYLLHSTPLIASAQQCLISDPPQTAVSLTDHPLVKVTFMVP